MGFTINRWNEEEKLLIKLYKKYGLNLKKITETINRTPRAVIFRLYLLKLISEEEKELQLQKYTEDIRRARYIPEKVKKEVKKRDDNCCRICKSDKELHFHHIIPFKHNKFHKAKNIMLLCETHHNYFHKTRIYHLEFIKRYVEAIRPLGHKTELNYCESCGHSHIKLI